MLLRCVGGMLLDSIGEMMDFDHSSIIAADHK
jgi:hypothetical protein